jgi:hypothetical protein
MLGKSAGKSFDTARLGAIRKSICTLADLPWQLCSVLISIIYSERYKM